MTISEEMSTRQRAKSSENVGPRIVREKEIVAIMIYKYCMGHGHKRKENMESGSDGMCADCKDLVRYAHARLALCRFGEDKTTCGRCPIHCYKPDRRVQIKAVMKYAGPRMLWSHPLESLRHALDKWIILK